MCVLCDYPTLIRHAGLSVTAHRLRVLEIIGNTAYPLSAQEIFEALNRIRPINRVTVYRILDTLVEHSLVSRLSGGGRAFFYGLAPNRFHAPHPHFYCNRCGRMDCLGPKSIIMNIQELEQRFSGRIQNIEIRVDGVCQTCLNESP